MLLSKYRPKTTKEIIGNGTAISQIKSWLGAWKDKDSKALYVYGPTGVGKTLAVELIAQELNYELLRCGADEQRSLAYLRTFISASGQQSLFFRKKLILIDDFDIIESKKGIAELIKESRCPIVLISGEYNLKPDLKRYCTVTKFTKPRYDQVQKFLEKIALSEKISISKPLLTRMARANDVRAALIDLETLSDGYRDTEDDIFAALRILFKTTSMENVPRREDLIAWVEENIPEEYQTREEIARAYDYLSKADLYTARIRKRQAWTLQKYEIELALYGVALSKTRQSNRFVNYRRPPFRISNEQALLELAQLTHTSRRKAREYMPLVNALAEIGIELVES